MCPAGRSRGCSIRWRRPRASVSAGAPNGRFSVEQRQPRASLRGGCQNGSPSRPRRSSRAGRARRSRSRRSAAPPGASPPPCRSQGHGVAEERTSTAAGRTARPRAAPPRRSARGRRTRPCPRASESRAEAGQSILPTSSPGSYGREPATSEPSAATDAVQAAERRARAPAGAGSAGRWRSPGRVRPARRAPRPAAVRARGTARGSLPQPPPSRSRAPWRRSSA